MNLLIAPPNSTISLFPPNPSPNYLPFVSNSYHNSNSISNSISNCKRIELCCSSSTVNSANVCSPREKLEEIAVKNVDVATLGNLCVDIVLNVPQLPPNGLHERKAYMEELASSPPHKQYWEAGGHCNTAIAAARLGLRCIAIGHVGNEIYGNFLLDVLQDEGIGVVGMSEDLNTVSSASAARETLLCWVLVDPLQRHGFCSRADFSDEPAFNWMTQLTADVKAAIKKSKILVVNGYGFDELPPSLIVSALKYAVKVGTAVFFDPGPRGRSLSSGTPEEQMALRELLKMSVVLLLTSEEAEWLTGIGNPILAGQELLRRSVRTKWVIVKVGSRGSILISLSRISCAPSFKVKVMDTVGCGDSFVAAIAYGFVHKLPMSHTLTIANAVGAATAMGSGAGRNVATFEQAINIIKTGDLNEDVEFWKKLLEENSSCDEDITLVSKSLPLGRGEGKVSSLSLTRIVPELINRLESREITKVSL